jgi:hypothetical protein
MSSFHPTPADAYEQLGVGAPPPGAGPETLYLDMVKRTLCNLIYEDAALWAYGPDKQMEPLNRFDIRRRVVGQDVPVEAHTMVGWRRLSNIETCAKAVIEADVPGDFVEAGVLRGGSSIFMRAVLKAYGITDRRVFACDTFVPPPERQAPLPVIKLLSLLTRIPSRAWHLRLYRLVEKQQKNWPASADPSDEWIGLTMGMIRYAARNRSLLQPKDRVSVQAVDSHFARYGLLDSQVVLLEGFFSDTLPKADIESIALLRCDGDTYESTRSVLDAVYDKVSPGGYVIVDDYYSFDDCKRAVDEFRSEHSIADEIVPIDDSAVYWQKSAAAIP